MKTLTSKNALCLSLPRKLCATMSSRAPYSRLAVLCSNCSSVTGFMFGSVDGEISPVNVHSCVQGRSKHYGWYGHCRLAIATTFCPKFCLGLISNLCCCFVYILSNYKEYIYVLHRTLTIYDCTRTIYGTDRASQ